MNLNVLLVNKLYYPVIGGVETHVRDLARFLPEDIKRKVLVATERVLCRTEKIDGVEVKKSFNLGTFKSSPVPPTFPFCLKKYEKWADIYHFHFPFPPGEISFLTARVKKPLVVTYHSDIVRQKTLLKAYRPLLERFLNRADKIIATSSNYIETSPYLSKRKEKCKVVPLGVNLSDLKLDSNQKKEVEKIRKSINKPIILFVGRLIYYKGIEYLIKALKNVDAELLIVGKGPLEEDLKNLAKKLKVFKRIRFFPHLSYGELVTMYHACDIFCLPSIERSEAFGIVQLEAQACEKPVVSTELGTGTSFANLDGVTGFVVPPKDVESLSEALNKLVESSALRTELGKQARKRVEKEFTVQKMASRVAKIYRKTAGLT